MITTRRRTGHGRARTGGRQSPRPTLPPSDTRPATRPHRSLARLRGTTTDAFAFTRLLVASRAKAAPFFLSFDLPLGYGQHGSSQQPWCQSNSCELMDSTIFHIHPSIHPSIPPVSIAPSHCPTNQSGRRPMEGMVLLCVCDACVMCVMCVSHCQLMSVEAERTDRRCGYIQGGGFEREKKESAARASIGAECSQTCRPKCLGLLHNANHKPTTPTRPPGQIHQFLSFFLRGPLCRLHLQLRARCPQVTTAHTHGK
ncbi:hypothetical protein BZA05DRAFT_22241 [Tricharina praecox]|uniref:uncharacterized protein n=1 Tax=Tricharina praecox TaxID=43433 RepID=UPI00221FB710|nr:uncharacterized protein BZA05DRAFT_22241 [Tricharina praecox]KAI5859134.1 hypothetical protein BZA05DRAFT_22241 [Tricharina praecox]